MPPRCEAHAVFESFPGLTARGSVDAARQGGLDSLAAGTFGFELAGYRAFCRYALPMEDLQKSSEMALALMKGSH